MARKEIGVKIILPQTAEGMAAFQRAMVDFHTTMLTSALNKSPLPRSRKQAIAAALDGHVPWEPEGQRRLAAYAADCT